MNEDQFQAFCDLAMTELEAKQHHLQKTFELTKWPRWWLNQENETLQFLDAEENAIVEADTINIGSYSSTSQTWMWAWSNASIPPSVQAKASKLKELKELTGFEIFAYENPLEIDEFMVWELAAIATKHLGAEGIYRAPYSEDAYVFLALQNMRKLTPAE